MKKRNGFTLVELLAVIVILAIILVIAVPQITKTIENARKGALESSGKLIAASAEREYLLAEATESSVDVSDCQKLASTDTVKSCNITVNSAGVATVTYAGNGSKYEYWNNCTATRSTAICQHTS